MKQALIITIFLALLYTLTACNSTGTKMEMAVGEIKVSQLFTKYEVFEKSFRAFDVSENDKVKIQQWPENIHIEVYFGTWCHDSEREVPRLLKLLENNKSINTQLIALDFQKSDPLGKSTVKGIKYTPTIIVYQNDKELGRIIERPKYSLVADINSLIQ